MGARSLNRKHGLAGIKRRQPVANPIKRARKHKLVAKKKGIFAEIKSIIGKISEIA